MNKEEMQLEHNKMVAEIITKCDYMIKNRIYMNDIAIKRCAEEIKLIAKFYIMEAKQMNKKIKVIELFDIIAKGIDIPARVEYRQKAYKFDSDIMDYASQDEEICLSLLIAGYDNFKESLNGEVEILEDEEEIDIQSIQELDELSDCEERNMKINEILRAVKQLDKKIDKED